MYVVGFPLLYLNVKRKNEPSNLFFLKKTLGLGFPQPVSNIDYSVGNLPVTCS